MVAIHLICVGKLKEKHFAAACAEYEKRLGPFCRLTVTELAEERLPEEVPVRRGAANRMTKTHHIRTDTGIEITFPSEFARKPELIEFQRDGDGSMRIVLKGIAHIESR